MDGAADGFEQVLSASRDYEWRADRWWGDGRRLVFVGCNPSVIEWTVGGRLDPTSANSVQVARNAGYDGVTMLNLWALRGTNPAALRGHADPVGPEWADWFDTALGDAGVVVVGWGGAPYAAGARLARARIAVVLDHLDALGVDVQCVGQTADGDPRHLSLRGLSRAALPALQPFVR